MRTVADFKEFILRWFRCDDWKDLSERDERQGGGYLLLRFWHIVHGIGNPEYQSIEKEITESDRTTPLTDGQWDALWVVFVCLWYRRESSLFFLGMPHEDALALLLQEKFEREEDGKFLEQEWEGGEEAGTFWIHVSRRSSVPGLLGGTAFDLDGNCHHNVVILAVEPEPSVGRWSEFVVRKAKTLTEGSDKYKRGVMLGKWTGKTKEGKYLLP